MVVTHHAFMAHMCVPECAVTCSTECSHRICSTECSHNCFPPGVFTHFVKFELIQNFPQQNPPNTPKSIFTQSEIGWSLRASDSRQWWVLPDCAPVTSSQPRALHIMIIMSWRTSKLAVCGLPNLQNTPFFEYFLPQYSSVFLKYRTSFGHLFKKGHDD